MKKIFYSAATLALLSSPVLSQNLIPNGDFETWDLYNTWTLEPEFWNTSNGQIIASVNPDSSSYQAELAMKVNVLPGFEGGVPQSASIFFALENNPEMISFAVKSFIDGDSEMDEVNVKVQFYLADAQIGDTLIWRTNLSIPQWELIEMEIPDLSFEADECLITVTAGRTNGFFGGSWNNWISVDAFEFSGTQSIDTNNCNSSIYPNPSQGNSIQIMDCGQAFTGIVAVYNVQGQLLLNENISSGNFHSALSPALYILSFVSQSGAAIKAPLLIIE